MQKPKLFLIPGMLLMAAGVHAQSVGPSAVDAAGASATTGGITHEYAIGQVVAGNTFSSGSLVVTPGVLQPIMSTGIKGSSIAADNLQVYPSPVETTLFLQPSFNAGGALQYSLYDAAGKLVLTREAKLQTGKERQEVEVSQLAVGQYMLNVSWTQGGQTSTAGFKVQKLN